MAQWIGICLPVQGTQVQSLVWEGSTCCRVTKPVRHYYWSLEPGAWSLCSATREATAHHNQRKPQKWWRPSTDPPQPKKWKSIVSLRIIEIRSFPKISLPFFFKNQRRAFGNIGMLCSDQVNFRKKYRQRLRIWRKKIQNCMWSHSPWKTYMCMKKLLVYMFVYKNDFSLKNIVKYY